MSSLEQIFGCASRFNRSSSRSSDSAISTASDFAAGASACKCLRGMPSCNNSSANCPTDFSPYQNSSRPESVNSPSTTASTSWPAQISSKRSRFSAGMAKTMRSCASDSQISQGFKPGYLSGARSRYTTAPSPSLISPTALENPPAPQSVNAEYKPSALTHKITSCVCFSAIGLPICTLEPAILAVLVSISRLEKVAPRNPSRPVRPPIATIKSPARALGGFAFIGLAGRIPTQPQNTSGFEV